jgi:methyl-accepting chemotaxis protein
MKWFYNLKISAKLIIGFALVAVIAGVLGVFGMINLKSLDDSDTALYERMTVPISQMSGISTAFQRVRVNSRDMVIAENQADIQSNIDKITDRRAEIDTLAAAFEKTIISDNMKLEFNNFIEARKVYRTELDKVIQLAKENKDEEAYASLAETGSAGIASRAEQDLIDKIINMKVQDAKNKSDDNTKRANSTMLVMGILIAVAMFLSILIGLLISKIISKPLVKAFSMIKEMGKGHLGTRLKMDTNDEVGQMAAAMDSFAEDLQNNVVGVMKKIAAGDVSINVQPKDSQDEITPAIKKTIETIRGLIDDTGSLVKATQEGKLDARGNANAYLGSWKEMMVGINKLIDAFVEPINVTAEYVDRISKGDIPAKISDTYKGDFNEIKNNLNKLIDNFNMFIAEMDNMSKQHNLGDIDAVVPDEKFEGAYKVMSKGVNDMVKGHISVKKKAMACIAEFSKGNFDAPLEKFPGKKAFINENIETMRKNLKDINSEINKLVVASEEGRLSERGNDKEFQGDWAALIKGLNGLIEKIVEPVMEAAAVLDEIAKGNLQTTVTGNYKGDHARIKEAMNQTITTLNDVLGDMNTAADQVASGSRQVSDSGQALAQGATEQAGSIQELTASMTEIAAQTRQNAVNANQANELAVVAKNNAAQGNEQMKEMLKAMDEINQSSSNISKIIKVIDEIAFQTNILALNAAVEAARAGQHGKGFAVVAEEVRNLAARSAKAAKETTSMIEGSIKKVEDGTKIAKETADALNKIVDGVAKAANIVGDIATASNEQATGIAQVNQGIEQVSQVTQTISATAEQSAAASQELSGQAELLNDMVAKFKLRKGEDTFGDISKLNPDIVRMLESISESKNASKAVRARNGRHEPIHAKNHATAGKASKPQISLSDREFDKY